MSTTNEAVLKLLAYFPKNGETYNETFKVKTQHLIEVSNIFAQNGIRITDADRRIDGDWNVVVEK